MAAILCCVVVVLAIIGIVLGVTLGKDDDEKPASKPTTPPPVPQTFLPTPPPTPPPSTAAPTPPPTIPNQIDFIATADTFVYLGSEETGGPFGNETFLLVQNSDTDQSATVAFMTFNVADSLPDPAEIVGWTTTATLVLTLLETDDEPLISNVTIETARFPAIEGDIEDIVQNISISSIIDAGTPGPSFEVAPGDTEVMVDLTSLLFGTAPVRLRRRMQIQETEFLIALFNNDVESVRFYSTQSEFPPRLEVGLMEPTSSPTMSSMPSTSSPPSLSPSVSPAPSVSPGPSMAPSVGPTSPPSVSPVPTETPFAGCFICGEGNEIVNPDFPLTLPVIGSTTCSGIDALSAAITEEQCAQLLPVVSPSCCGTPYICDICSGAGNVTNPTDVVTIPGQEDRTCSGYAALGSVGAIPEANCAGLQQVAGPLCCGTSAPFVCSICSDGGNVTNPTAVVTIPGQDDRTCSEYAALASTGAIPEANCVGLQQITDQVCCGIELRK